MTNSPQPAAIPAKTLYLDGRGRLRVWREGPSLCVFARDKALQRVPLQRISRIVVSGQVEWATPALIACAEAGIGVVFLRGNGAVRARLQGPCTVHDYTGLAEMLDHVLENPQGSYWVRQWLGACAQQARRQLCLAARVVPRSTRTESVHAYVSRRALLHVRHAIAYPRLNFATVAGFYESQAPRVAEAFRQLQIRLHKTLLEVSRDHAG